MESFKFIDNDMRSQEAVYSLCIPPDSWIILRLDGRGFSQLTEQHFEKPFDQRFHECMVTVARAIMTDLQAAFAYTGSDEISLILSPAYTSHDRRMEKLLSIPAGIASSVFTKESQILAQFDCRVNAFGTVDDVVRYCGWRCADVQRNSLSTMTYWILRGQGMTGRQVTKMMSSLTQDGKRALLAQVGIIYENIPAWQREGIALVWESYTKTGYDPIAQEEVLAQRRRLVEKAGADATWLTSYLQGVGQQVENQKDPKSQSLKLLFYQLERAVQAYEDGSPFARERIRQIAEEMRTGLDKVEQLLKENK